jgi:BirA family biotin operon repressor/biotin-[acetyl-CoA-carboxylase] ligase
MDRFETGRLGEPWTVMEETDSTNQRAMEAVKRGEAGHGAVFTARRQSAGRGSGGRRWISDEATGLWCSVVIVEGAHRPGLTLLPAVAIAQVLRERVGIDAHLKWPNDVLVGTRTGAGAGTGTGARKIAGVLVETVATVDGEVGHVVGLGVNVLQEKFAGELDGLATSVLMETGRVVEVEQLGRAIVARMDEMYRQAIDLSAAWSVMTRMIGREVVLRHADQVAGEAERESSVGRRETEERVTVVGIDGDGGLVVRGCDGGAKKLTARSRVEIHWIDAR